MTLKEPKENKKKIQKKEIVLKQEEQEKAQKNLEAFLEEFILKLPEGTTYEIKKTTSHLEVNIKSENLGYLIGYRGETLYALQNILSAIAGKNIENRVRVILDIGEYKVKREKTLEELAEKVVTAHWMDVLEHA